MYAVVNHLPIREGADWADIAAKFAGFEREMRKAHPELRSVVVVKASDAEAILFALYQDRESMERLSRTVAAPWFAEHIRPFLSGPVSRSTGEVIAGAP